MESPTPVSIATPSSASARRNHVHQAKVLRGLASASQIIVMVALYVLWRRLNWGFWQSLEVCLVIGVLIYMALFGAAAIVLVVYGLEPVALLVGPATRLISVILYATLRFGQKVHWFKSIAIIFVLYVTAWFLVRRIERRARRRFGW